MTVTAKINASTRVSNIVEMKIGSPTKYLIIISFKIMATPINRELINPRSPI
jgi:hypothetical protein